MSKNLHAIMFILGILKVKSTESLGWFHKGHTMALLHPYVLNDDDDEADDGTQCCQTPGDDGGFPPTDVPGTRVGCQAELF